jgi:hypothetical protein
VNSVVVGIGHRARNGKDHFAKFVVEQFVGQYNIQVYSFGKALKMELYDILLQPLHPYWDFADGYLKLPHPREQFVKDEDKVAWVEEHKAELVGHMQKYGTEYKRAQNPFYWVNAVARQISVDNPQFALIPDLRFVNEYLWIRAVKGKTVKVSRWVGDTLYCDPSRDPNHPSEIELANAIFDYSVDVQDGDLAELKADAKAVFERIVKSFEPEVPEADDFIKAA